MLLYNGRGRMTTSISFMYAICLAPSTTGRRSSAKRIAAVLQAAGSNHARPTFDSTATTGLPIVNLLSKRGETSLSRVASRQGDRSFCKEKQSRSAVSRRLASPTSEHLTIKYVQRRIAREAHSVNVWRQVPVGGWPNNRRLAETGEYVRLTLENDVEGMLSSRAFLVRVF